MAGGSLADMFLAGFRKELQNAEQGLIGNDYESLVLQRYDKGYADGIRFCIDHMAELLKRFEDDDMEEF